MFTVIAISDAWDYRHSLSDDDDDDDDDSRPKAGSLAFTPPGDEMSEVVSCCLYSDLR